MLEARQDSGTTLASCLGVPGAGIELAALAGGDGLRTILVLQDEGTLKDEQPGREAVRVQLAGLRARFVVGDADLVVEAIGAQPGPELGLVDLGGWAEHGDQSPEQLLDAVKTRLGVLDGHRIVLFGAQRCVAIGKEADTVTLFGDEPAEQLARRDVDGAVTEVVSPPVSDRRVAPPTATSRPSASSRSVASLTTAPDQRGAFGVQRVILGGGEERFAVFGVDVR